MRIAGTFWDHYFSISPFGGFQVETFLEGYEKKNMHLTGIKLKGNLPGFTKKH
jgi:hypothetical protein